MAEKPDERPEWCNDPRCTAFGHRLTKHDPKFTFPTCKGRSMLPEGVEARKVLADRIAKRVTAIPELKHDVDNHLVEVRHMIDRLALIMGESK